MKKIRCTLIRAYSMIHTVVDEAHFLLGNLIVFARADAAAANPETYCTRRLILALAVLPAARHPAP